ncbi:MAG: MerR family transcriptional regulator [Dehalococcoidia bacterium]
MNVDRPLLTMGAVVKRTGVPADTIRAWERRYGVPRPERNASGRRLYSERDLDLIRQLRQRDTGAAEMAAAMRPTEHLPDTVLLDALVNLDPLGAERRIADLGALVGPDRFVEAVCWPTATALPTLDASAFSIGVQLLRAALVRLIGVCQASDGLPVIAAGLGQSDIRSLAVALLVARRGRPVVALGPFVAPALLDVLVGRLDAATIVEGTDPLPASLAGRPAVTIGFSAPDARRVESAMDGVDAIAPR